MLDLWWHHQGSTDEGFTRLSFIFTLFEFIILAVILLFVHLQHVLQINVWTLHPGRRYDQHWLEICDYVLYSQRIYLHIRASILGTRFFLYLVWDIKPIPIRGSVLSEYVRLYHTYSFSTKKNKREPNILGPQLCLDTLVGNSNVICWRTSKSLLIVLLPCQWTLSEKKIERIICRRNANL